MARPIKQGLDYFPLDVDFFNDDKIQLIEAEFGIKGTYIAIRLLTKIYSEGYYYEWSADKCLLLTKNIGDESVSNGLVNEVVNGLIRRGIFSNSVFSQFNILTSTGIQKRFLNAISRRTIISIIKEIWLISIPKNINVNIYSINDNINSINVDNNTQSKVKESKVEGRKLVVKESAEICADQPTDPLPPSMPTGKPGTAEKNAEQKTPLPEIQKLLLAYAEAKGIRLATHRERRTYLTSSPHFYPAKNLIEAAGGTDQAIEAVKAMAQRYEADNKPQWQLDWAARDYWEWKARDESEPPESGPKADNYSRCECGQLLGGASIRIEIGQEQITAAIAARCPICDKVYGIQPLEDFPRLGITQARLLKILRQSRLESFSQKEWAEWLELVP